MEVRSVAVAGVLHLIGRIGEDVSLIANYYELLPVSVTTMIFDHFTQHLSLIHVSFIYKDCFELLFDRIGLTTLTRPQRETVCEHNHSMASHSPIHC